MVSMVTMVSPRQGSRMKRLQKFFLTAHEFQQIEVFLCGLFNYIKIKKIKKTTHTHFMKDIDPKMDGSVLE